MSAEIHLERFFSRVEIRDNGCWIWTGPASGTKGYGSYRQQQAPRPRADGRCVQCGKPKRRSRSAAKGANKAKTNYTRQDRKMWLIHLERDAFCSRVCLEDWLKIRDEPKERVCDFPSCDTRFTPLPNQTRQRFCSKKCRDADKKAPKYDIPGRCRGCGGHRSEYVKGCAQCGDRRRSRARRENPDYVASELLRAQRRRDARNSAREQRLEEAA